MAGRTGNIIYKASTSQQAQANFRRQASALQAILSARLGAINKTKGGFQATDVSDAYSKVEKDWIDAAEEVGRLINACKKTMEDNDQTARTANKKAVDAMRKQGLRV